MQKEEKNAKIDEKKNTNTCPECGSESVQQTGHCKTCLECGWSACSL